MARLRFVGFMFYFHELTDPAPHLTLNRPGMLLGAVTHVRYGGWSMMEEGVVTLVASTRFRTRNGSSVLGGEAQIGGGPLRGRGKSRIQVK